MNNPKIDKVNLEIEKTKAKISEFQTKLRGLERQKTDLEDAQIVALVRSERISDAELTALMASLRSNGKDAAPAEPSVSKPTTTRHQERTGA